MLLSNERDISVDWVVRLLRARGVNYFRLNTERVLERTLQLRPLERTATLTGQEDVVDLSAVSAVWYRRPDPPQLASSMTSAEKAVVKAQWRVAIRGLTHTLRARWVNHPDRNDDAEQKLLQLRIAKEIGFQVPSTLVTTDADAVRAFAERHLGAVIVKGLDAPHIEDEAGSGRFLFTTRIADLPTDLEGLEQSPLIFQEEIAPKRDIRVTVIGDTVLAAAPLSPLAHVDWRALADPPPFERFELPSEIARMSVEVVRAFGLVFGALDLVQDEAGAYWFLELNPNGEWGWLQKKAGLPIAEAIARELVKAS